MKHLNAAFLIPTYNGHPFSKNGPTIKVHTSGAPRMASVNKFHLKYFRCKFLINYPVLGVSFHCAFRFHLYCFLIKNYFENAQLFNCRQKIKLFSKEN